MHDIINILCMCRMIIGIYMHVRACHDTVHEYIYDQEHIMCSLYIQTLPQLEVCKQSTDGDMHAIGRYFISEELEEQSSEIPCMQVIVNFCDLHIQN